MTRSLSVRRCRSIDVVGHKARAPVKRATATARQDVRTFVALISSVSIPRDALVLA